MAEKRIVLKDEADAAAASGNVSDIAAMEGDSTVVYAGEAGNRAQQRAFAAAAGAEQNKEFTVANVE